MTYSIVVPNYDGVELLRAHFPSVHRFAEAHGMELIVVDDASRDASVQYLRESHPGVRLLENAENVGFGEACNRGVLAARGRLVFLFNTDVEVSGIDLGVVEAYAQKPDFFALTLKSLYPGTGAFREGAKWMKLKRGLPFALHNPKDQRRDAQGNAISIYPVGGHCVVTRERFAALGGFSAAYAPFYWEDMDLGFRARRRGWVTYYDDRLAVTHDHRGTIKTTFQEAYIDRVKLRNRIVFMLSNYTPGQRVVRFYPGMLLRSVENLCLGRWGFFGAWRDARRRVREAAPSPK